MKIVNAQNLTGPELVALCRRPWTREPDLSDTVRAICGDVKLRGDVALAEYNRRFDAAPGDVFRVGEQEIADVRSAVAPEQLEAMQAAAKNIRTFHKNQIRREPRVETVFGVTCWRESRPIDRVGLYVPAGSAPLPSTMLMLGIPAVLAGCPRIIVCTPPKANGSVDPLVLVAADMIGVREIYKVGGAQAIAAMAYGTESVPKVDKIFGPGNRYVTTAKQFVGADHTGVAIDLLAGPSELLVIADESADAKTIAADLMSQAEHDANSQVALVTTDRGVADKTVLELNGSRSDLPRLDIITRALEDSFALVVGSLDEAIRFSNEYAPEHLIINIKEPQALVSSVRNAGSVFLGSFAPVTAGDYASGTNHTLPTGGSARWSGGLSVDSFQKSVTFQTITIEGLANLAPILTVLADAEGLEAHRRAVTIRL